MTSEFTIAVHALVFLSHKGTVYSSEGLAENVCTNAARIRKVMAKLKKANLIKTKEGAEGGYLFHRDASEVNLLMIADALQTSFVTTAWKSGDPEKDCLVSSGMAGILTEIYDGLDQRCRERLKEITISDIEDRIFASHPDKR
ncbi:Rrf2 family transcriptional regulator [uncultured Clostridium sp.]|uniref:RrF2 family transcriptional regulator n=1 Tax=uncultured Clostridium sp. TaxID=59620 RepID=UPI0025CD989A|nr:Rrf2 family transcriptional regulator [uncultured Clostridium sp.]